MSCGRCGGTGEIPLLGANTTSCPDCSKRVWAWKYAPVEENILKMWPMFFDTTEVRFLTEGDVVEIDLSKPSAVVRRKDGTVTEMNVAGVDPVVMEDVVSEYRKVGVLKEVSRD